MADRAGSPSVADRAPSDGRITEYDRSHFAIYTRLLDAERAGASAEEMARNILGLDPGDDAERARRAVASHLERAHWMTVHGYRQLAAGRR
ncbi:MAG: DUF2285 domain-containing protein [Azospirillum sp.]|nr:DUF2285 domain-containing protein [Azospirillum sp.]